MVMSTRASTVLAIGLLIASTAQQNANADRLRGKALAEQQCSHCHGVKRGEKSPYVAVPSFTEVAAEPSMTEYALRSFLRTPHPTMPNLIIAPVDIDDIVGYIVSLKQNH